MGRRPASGSESCFDFFTTRLYGSATHWARPGRGGLATLLDLHQGWLPWEVPLDAVEGGIPVDCGAVATELFPRIVPELIYGTFEGPGLNPSCYCFARKELLSNTKLN